MLMPTSVGAKSFKPPPVRPARRGKWSWFWNNAAAAHGFWYGEFRDLISGKKAVLPTTPAFSFGLGLQGSRIRMPTTGSGTTHYGTSLPMVTTNNYTFFSLFRAEDTSGNGSDTTARFTGINSASFGDGAILSISKDGTLNIFTSGGNTIGSGVITVDDGRWHACAVAFNQLTDQVIQIIDGREDVTVSSYTDDSSNVNGLFGFAFANGTTSVVEVAWHAVLATTITLTKEQMKMWTRDPYGPLRPVQRRIVANVAVAGRIMSSLAGSGGLAAEGGIAGAGGGLAG